MNSLFHRLVFCAVLWMTTLAVFGSPRAEHVFIISIDGGKPAVIAQSDMPVLKHLAEAGACTWAASTIYPSITLPSHTSMLTGVGPDKHHILWNSWKPSKGS
jgi:predicted AlkP superfamily pyrophosphatase or phosphodiesterase